MCKEVDSVPVLDELATILRTDRDKGIAILNEMGSIRRYHPPLVETLLGGGDAEGSGLVLKFFAPALSTFPVESIERLLGLTDDKLIAANSESLLRLLAEDPQRPHRRIHAALLKSLLNNAPIDPHVYKYMAKLLQIYPAATIKDMMTPYWNDPTGKALWLVREIESLQKNMLVSEDGQWL